MLVAQDSIPMDNSGFFVQGTFGPNSEGIPIGSSNSISPSHRNVLTLNHSNSESSIPRSNNGSIHHAQTHAQIQGNANNSNTGSSNEVNSPLHLTSMLNNLSLSGAINPALQQQTQSSQRSHQDLHSLNQGSYILKLKNIPSDITIRESHALFALATGVSKIEIIEERKDSISNEFELSIIAMFNSLNLVTHYASILSSKTDIFGPTFPFTSYVEVIDELSNQKIPFQKPKFNYQLSSSCLPISPVTSIHQSNQPSQQSVSQAQGPVQSQGQPPNHSQSQHQSQSQSQVESQGTTQAQSQPSQQVSPVPTSGNMARPSLVQTRSRFSFSDPFSNPTDANQPNQNQQRPKSTSQTGPAITHSRSHQESQSTDVGKSLLLMENDDINDSIWGSNTMPTSMNGFTNSPQPSTPILEWGPSGRKQSSSFFLSQAGSATVGSKTAANQNIDVTSTMHSITGNPSNGSTISSPFAMLSQVPGTNSQTNISNVLGSSNGNVATNDVKVPATSSVNIGVGPRKHGVYKQAAQGSQQQQPPQQLQETKPSQDQQSPSSQTSTPQKGSQIRSNIRSSHATSGGQKGSISNSSSSTNVAGSTTISQADLSLLARVPPPANPADQNPPCNTLYVGNLPPDTTEQELRQLFSGQQGFRRLSFRNKNSNGNGHGPMCFVEFEDVSFATRALAELYGSQLPRANASNKGGIRLSFSKNPLGVRGPNNRRGNNSTSVNSPTGTNSNGNSGFVNYSYSAGYSKP